MANLGRGIMERPVVHARFHAAPEQEFVIWCFLGFARSMTGARALVGHRLWKARQIPAHLSASSAA